MEHLKLFEEYNSNRIYAGKEVAEFIKNITPEFSDVPDYFISKFILPNKFERREINLTDLLKTDGSFKEYFDSKEVRYKDDEVDMNDLELPIVVFDGQVLDGYSRAFALLNNGGETTMAFVNINT